MDGPGISGASAGAHGVGCQTRTLCISIRARRGRIRPRIRTLRAVHSDAGRPARTYVVRVRGCAGPRAPIETSGRRESERNGEGEGGSERKVSQGERENLKETGRQGEEVENKKGRREGSRRGTLGEGSGDLGRREREGCEPRYLRGMHNMHGLSTVYLRTIVYQRNSSRRRLVRRGAR